MSLKKWHGQQSTFEIDDPDLADPAVGVLQDVSISPSQEVQELRGTGDVRWVDLMRTGIGVEVSGTVSAWAIDTWDVLVDYDEAAGAFPSGSEVPTFTVTVGLESSDGSTKDITAEPGYLDPLPEISGGRDEWIGMSLNFSCKEITDITNTDASA